MFEKVLKRKWKINLKSFFFYFFFLLLIFGVIFTGKKVFNQENNLKIFPQNESGFLSSIFDSNRKKNYEIRRELFLKNAQEFLKADCEILEIDFYGNICKLKKESLETCIENKELFYSMPKCLRYKVYHRKTPKVVRAIYYSAYGASQETKIKKLIKLKEDGKINAVVIDVKEIHGKLYFKVPLNNFKIKPQWKVILRNPKELLERLHKEDFYIIARIVIFKDKDLAQRRPDLAVKKADRKTVWKDYRGKSWIDPGAKEAWDYNLEIARQAYLLGFDEINLDYVRFPTDGPMKNIYYPFSNEAIELDKKWGRAKVLDEFFNYFTRKLREEFPEIKISADVFGQVAINNDDVSIGQILESALLYFDAVAPMAYPSHYSWNFVPFYDGPDNHPYEVLDKTAKKASQKIERINLAIKKAQNNKEEIFIREDFPAKMSFSEVGEIDKNKIRFWLQAFTCTWCQNYKRYGQEEVQKQIKAIKDNGYNSWMLWNASSYYNENIFDN